MKIELVKWFKEAYGQIGIKDPRGRDIGTLMAYEVEDMLDDFQDRIDEEGK